MRTGRPSTYRPEFAEQAKKLCRLSATDVDIAGFFGVNVRTIVRWKNDHEDFCLALKLGKDEADAVVADRLFKRATGYSHDAQKILQYEGKPVVIDYVEHHPPDTTACIFWLKNRRPKEWRDRQDIRLQQVDEFEDLSDEELRALVRNRPARRRRERPANDAPDTLH
jgi:hypothetical protein